MTSTAAHSRKPGLRELKKQRTRQTILTAALELFAQRGYTHTTLEDIARAAEVSTGTLFAYFPNKEDILFPEEREFYEQLKQRLDQRATGVSTFDVLRNLLTTLQLPDKTFSIRVKILQDEGLRDRQRTRFMRVEHLLAESIAADLGAQPDDLRPTLLAACAAAALAKMAERLQPDAADALPLHDALATLEHIFNLLHRGLTELEAPR